MKGIITKGNFSVYAYVHTILVSLNYCLRKKFGFFSLGKNHDRAFLLHFLNFFSFLDILEPSEHNLDELYNIQHNINIQKNFKIYKHTVPVFLKYTHLQHSSQIIQKKYFSITFQHYFIIYLKICILYTVQSFLSLNDLSLSCKSNTKHLYIHTTVCESM